jgi:hypothetical protein
MLAATPQARLPDKCDLKLRSYTRDYPDAKLADLAADPSYATAARGLRKMIDRRTEAARGMSQNLE